MRGSSLSKRSLVADARGSVDLPAAEVRSGSRRRPAMEGQPVEDILSPSLELQSLEELTGIFGEPQRSSLVAAAFPKSAREVETCLGYGRLDGFAQFSNAKRFLKDREGGVRS